MASGETNRPAGSAGSTRRRRDALSARLGISSSDLKRLRQRITWAESSLQGCTPRVRKEKAAERLGITASELKLLRGALNDAEWASDERLSSVIRTVLDADPQTSSAPTDTSSSRNPTGGPAKGSKPTATRANPVVFVTKWGQAAHLFYECHNIRGFREEREADPDIYRVLTNDPSCRGRRVCGSCKRLSSADAERARQALRKFHGPPFTESKWQDESCHRVHPKEPPHIRGRG